MLTRSFRFLDPANISPDLSLRLRRLADDCDRLELHRSVLPSTLKNAPLLENWLPSLTPEGLHLVGVASGHPIHGDRIVMTTPLWWADPEGTWVRSLSRFYRLGSPATRDGLRGVRLVSH
ncbi:hypothetical protein XI03_35355 [Bradyrhizobium sp. CCBAU 65884]|uniref:DUF6634 family protein n=1 Tax=Bradyrhizobium sp. CCBAU 65884 TaxID=722477 RepID=UPI003FA4C727|nr:hypothetical protein [Bradyrhizobium sp. CCBAU 65884]